MSDSVLVRGEGLRKHFLVQKGFFSQVRGVAQAVDDVTLEVSEGETLALVGESGCGKTTVARLIMGLIPASEGSVTFMGHDVFSRDERVRRMISREMQMIFQDVSASLNPRKTVRHILSQPYLLHGERRRREVDGEVANLLETVELTPARIFLDRFPHELSGGQKQRVNIARAIALRPRFVVTDEPVSGLDMSVRAAILELMKTLQREYNQGYLFITHDLAIVRSLSDRVAVMYLGKIVEEAPTEQLFAEPLHPYTRALLAATPIPNPRAARKRERVLLAGEVPSCIDPPRGCRFHPRCSQVSEACRKEEPRLRAVGASRLVACDSI